MLIQIGESDKLIDCIDAITPEEQHQGLVGIRALGFNEGMLFVYDEMDKRSFYMPEEMNFPIDIVFINDHRKVTQVFHGCEPGERDYLHEDQYRVFSGVAKWVVEVNAGVARALGIDPGVTINFDDEDEECESLA